MSGSHLRTLAIGLLVVAAAACSSGRLVGLAERRDIGRGIRWRCVGRALGG